LPFTARLEPRGSQSEAEGQRSYPQPGDVAFWEKKGSHGGGGIKKWEKGTPGGAGRGGGGWGVVGSGRGGCWGGVGRWGGGLNPFKAHGLIRFGSTPTRKAEPRSWSSCRFQGLHRKPGETGERDSNLGAVSGKSGSSRTCKEQVKHALRELGSYAFRTLAGAPSNLQNPRNIIRRTQRTHVSLAWGRKHM